MLLSELRIKDDAIRLQLVLVKFPYISLLHYRVRASARAAQASYAMRHICAKDPLGEDLDPFPRTRPHMAAVGNNLPIKPI